MRTTASERMRRGVTMIELLVVVAIILLLMSILIPAVNAARKSAQRTDARANVAMILHAFKQYYNEYQCWPTNLVGPDVETGETGPGLEMQSSVVAMLSGLNVSNNNPRQTAFLHANQRAIAADGSFKDPWGNPFRYMCDFNFNGQVDVRFGSGGLRTNLLETGVAVWSLGPDKSDAAGNNKDDIVSWE